MHFTGSVYGLQVGAPVVFRGVRVGSVESIEVFYDRATDTFSIPVVAELDGDAVGGLDGRRASSDVALALPALVKRGLTAQLAQQSFLTGLLYVDLDLRPQRTGSLRGTYRGAPEIPTSATAFQALKSQLEGMDFRRITEDLSAIAASARSVVAGSGPQLKQALDDLTVIAATVRRLSERLDKRVDPLAADLQRSMASARAALDRVGRAADGVDDTAGRLGVASDRIGALVAADAPLVANLQRAVDEVARTAAALRQATSGDSTLVNGTTRAMQDLSNAARALRDLAEALEAQPESLLRGRKVTE
jgi:paraquat-inducible protein B